jgi:hypothetical protein
VDSLADPIHGAGTTFPVRMGEHEDGCCSNAVPYKQYYKTFRSEVITVVHIKIIEWNVMLFSLADRYRQFRGYCCFCHLG